MSARRLQISPDRDVEEMRIVDVRAAIAGVVGLNRNPNYGFGKRDWNSVYAFLTGEFHFPKRDYRTPRSSSLPKLRADVAETAGIDTYTDPERCFRRDELRELYRVVKRRTDQRPWPE